MKKSRAGGDSTHSVPFPQECLYALKNLAGSRKHRASPAERVVGLERPCCRWNRGLQVPRPGRLLGLGHMDRLRGRIRSIRNPFLSDPDVCSPNPVSSSLEGEGIGYLGILSSTSTGHQPKISHVFTEPLKGTQLPVRIPVGRQEPLGSHPVLGFHLRVGESQGESERRRLSEWRTAWWGVGYRERRTQARWLWR